MYTANNNATMKTVVELFVIEETQELIYDNEKLEQWNGLVSELGLKGQTEIVAKDKCPIPYLFINEPMSRVFETLCPRKVPIQQFNKTPIPAEILSLCAMSAREEHFSKIEIWYCDENPDPFCIGFAGSFGVYDRSYKTYANVKTEAEAIAMKDDGKYCNHHFVETGKYLIGRWGDVKMSIDALTEKAKKLFMFSEKGNLNKTIREAQRKLEDLEHDADVKFGLAMPSTNFPF